MRGWFIALLLSCALAQAQTGLWRQANVRCSTWFGLGQFGLGDLDGDGHGDFATPVARLFGCTQQMEAWTWSGRTGNQIGSPVVLPVVVVAALGDVDLDGVMDYFGLSGQSCSAYSGRTGQMLWLIPESGALLGEVDVNADGVPDCVIADERANNYGGWFQVREGRTGRLLYRFDGIRSVVQVGSSLGSVGDIDQDGADDFLVGCSWIAAAQTDAVAVMSGRLGVPIRFGLGDRITGTAYARVSGAGDVDRDGIPDFAGSGAGGAFVFSGRTGATLHRIGPFPGSSFGIALTGGEDLDQDGCADLIVSTLWETVGRRDRIEALSGRDGTVLWTVWPIAPSGISGLGYPGTFRMLSSQPGSPFPMVVACDPTSTSGTNCCHDHDSYLRLFRSIPPGVEPYGTSCAPSAPEPPRVGIRSFANSARITVVDAPAGGIGVLLLGTSRTRFGSLPLPFPLDSFGLVGCQLLTSVELNLPVTLGSAGIDRGYAKIDLPVRLVPPGVGTRSVYAQWLVVDLSVPLLTGVSQALSLTVQ